MLFGTAHFNELDFCSNLSPHPRVILHAGLARSCRIHISKSGGKPSPSGEDAHQTDEGCEKVFLSGPHPPSATFLALPESEDYLL